MLEVEWRAPEPVAIADNLVERLWFGDDDEHDAEMRADCSRAAGFARSVGLQPFPAVAARLISLLQRTDFDLGEIRQLIESDPALASKLLRLVNSAAFAGRTEIRSIHDALVRLGIRRVHELATVIATAGMFHDNTGEGRKIRDHCVGVAAVVRALALPRPRCNVGQLFVAALLHDVGKLLLLQSGESIGEGLQLVFCEPDAAHIGERERIGFDHATLGAMAIVYWELPDALAKTIGWHHKPGSAFEVGGEVAAAIAFLRLANALDYQLQRSEQLCQESLAMITRDSAAEYLGITSVELEQEWHHLVSDRKQLLQMFAAQS